VTLKARLVLAVSVIAVVLVVAAVAITRTTQSYLVDQVDQQLVRFAGPSDRSPAPALIGVVATGFGSGTTFVRGTAIEGPAPPSANPFFTQPVVREFPSSDDDTTGRFSAVYVGVFDGSTLGTSVRAARVADTPAVPDIDRAAAQRLAADETVATVGASDGSTHYRVTSRVSSDGALVVVASPLDDVEASMRRLVTVLVGAGAVVMVVLALITWWVLRLGVRPVQQMTGAAIAVADGAMDERIPDAPAGTEAADLGRALNAMLERISGLLDERVASEQRLRRFLSDASHELRTPVTTIRGYAELYRSGGLDPGPGLDAAMARTESEAVRLGRLVEEMTLLARLDERRTRAAEDVDLAVLVEHAASDLRVTHPDRAVTTRVEPARVLGDPDALHQVLTNLLDNAARHTPPGTPVEVRVATTADGTRFEVVDHGAGVSPETASRAFERFYRADPSRNRASGGSGLGLAIVAAIVDAHGGTVVMRSRPGDDPDGRGTTVVVDLPAADAPRSASTDVPGRGDSRVGPRRVVPV
jgi:two-component system OmpR family sensor kinase